MIVNNKLAAQFEQYLTNSNKGYKTNTVEQYVRAIDRICKEENDTWIGLGNRIASIVPLYDVGGAKEAKGKTGHNTWICALKHFQAFCAKNHHWTYGEDFICCVLYIQTYLVNRQNTSLTEIMNMAKPLLQGIGVGSKLTNTIRNKFGNIRQISIDKQLNSDTCPFAPYTNASDQNRDAFDKAYAILI